MANSTKISRINKSKEKQEEKYKAFALMVIDWYEKCGRHDLVWRQKINPYKILVSEIMLQQTQVSRVLPKFTVWMKKYPTLEKLSQASLTDILLLWQGLGYQRRAKALLMLAKTTTRLPKTESELIALPGIGPYTAGAIMAFAYDKESLMLETNIRTALINAFHMRKKDIDDTLLKKDLQRLLQQPEVKVLGARHWYYALMDYGAFLKTKQISHNKKVKGYRPQTKYEGSDRKLRAEILFAITKGTKLPEDNRVPALLRILAKEGFIVATSDTWSIV